MRTKTHLIDLTFRRIEGGGHSGQQEMYDCPYCGGEGKFAVDRVLMVGKCWSAGCSAAVRVTDGDDSPRTKVLAAPEPKRMPVTCTLPPWKELGIEAFAYLNSDKRGLCPNAEVLAERYALRQTNTGGQCTRDGDRWDCRILIPIFQDGQLFSYVAADYLGNAKKKVLSGPNGAGEGALFYAEPIGEWTGGSVPRIRPAMGESLVSLIITEGCWDAMKVGTIRPAVAILGSGGKHGLSDAQLVRVLRATHPGTKITVMLDPDASSKALKITNQVRAYRAYTMNMTPYMDADPCDSSYTYLKEILKGR